jgi:hypothetical protein
MTDKMKLPNGDLIELGGYGVTRDGRKVGPMVKGENKPYPFTLSNMSYDVDGCRCNVGKYRADIIAAWKEPAAEPVMFKDMTDAEKGALLLAKHRGEIVQYWGPSSKEWIRFRGVMVPDLAYRVAPPEPKIEYVRDPSWLGGQKVTACYAIVDGVADIASYRLEPRI